MVTKRQLAELVRGLASRQSADFSTPLADIELLVGQLRDEALVAEYYAVQQQAGERELLGELVNTFYDVPVAYDAQRDREYAVLPARVLPLPGGRGVFAVFGPGAEAPAFVITPAGTQQLLVNHPAATLFGQPACWAEAGRRQEPGRLWMKQGGTMTLYPNLTIQLVVAAAHVGPELPFPCPSHLQTKIVNAAVQRLLQQPAEDRAADNRDQA